VNPLLISLEFIFASGSEDKLNSRQVKSPLAMVV